MLPSITKSNAKLTRFPSDVHAQKAPNINFPNAPTETFTATLKAVATTCAIAPLNDLAAFFPNHLPNNLTPAKAANQPDAIKEISIGAETIHV